MRLVFLSERFYDKYSGCEEILKKPNRPYMFLSVIVRGRQYAIPIRHHIRHSYAFFTIDDAGLDYTKAVAIDDPEYISAEIPWINQKEFDAIKKNEEAILRGFCKYLRIYEKAVKYKDNPHYQTILRYSSLRYFR